MSTIPNQEYSNWIVSLKSSIKQRQIKAAIAVNSNLIMMYWELGKQIVERQEEAKWGTGFIDQLSKDLKSEFPDIKGFSRSNLFAIKKFYLFYRSDFLITHQGNNEEEINEDLKLISESGIVHQAGGQVKNELIHQAGGQFEEGFLKCFQVPWRHNVTIIEKVKSIKEACFYINETVKNSWSRSVLEYQIETNLFSRQGNTVNNFKNTLPGIQGDLARELLKDPYNFEFLTLSTQAKEKDLEQKLIQHISQFLLELGKGFAYLGRQFQLRVGSKEYRTDLLFYHTKLKCYIVIELKLKEFEPEFIGKLNFYITAINEIVKDKTDSPTIGILLCKTKDNFEVEFALRDINKPIGVSEFNYTQLPDNIKESLPSLEEFENELKRIEQLE